MYNYLCLFLLISLAYGDLYMHNPRGSNNRLNEQNAEREDGDRMFDSQNNNRGGYNVGDKSATAATSSGDQNTDTTFSQSKFDTLYDINTQTAVQYPMVYYEGSVLSIEWTNQHGCGGNEDGDANTLNCNIVAQYMCDTKGDEGSDTTMTVKLRDGTTTNQVGTDGSPGDQTRGVHESAGYYSFCSNRHRNTGLFTADQQLTANRAIYTRQNPNNNRRGLECPEERDYYPYWLPTPFIDIAYLTDQIDKVDPNYGICDFIRNNTQNLNLKYRCSSRHNTRHDCYKYYFYYQSRSMYYCWRDMEWLSTFSTFF